MPLVSTAALAFKAQGMCLGDLLSGNRKFEIPIFQRSFSWTAHETDQLMSDLWVGLEDARERAAAFGGLFIGSLVVIEPAAQAGEEPGNGTPPAGGRLDVYQVIDGKQRLTTVTILLAALRDRLGDRAPWIDDLLWISQTSSETTDGATGSGQHRPARLSLGPDEDAYFAIQVRRPGASKDPAEPDPGNSGAVCIHECQQAILADFDGRTDADLVEFAEFLRTRVALVTISAPDIDTGFRVFVTTNHRGKQLTSTDILKGELIAGLPEQARQQALERWRNDEKRLGSDFALLPNFVRLIHGKGRGATINEVLQIAAKSASPTQFLDGILFPMADALYHITTAGYREVPRASDINRSLRILGWLRFQDWIWPALHFAYRFPGRDNEFATFLAALERLTYGMLIIGTGGARRLARYRLVVDSLSGDLPLDGTLGPLGLSREEKSKLVLNASSNLHQRSSATCKLLLKRLSAELPFDDINEPLSDVTVEHLLPTNVPEKSPWHAAIPDAAERQACNKLLGNLFLVTKQQNKAARNLGLEAKLRVIFPGGAQSPHAITNQLMGARSWTGTDIRARDAILQKILREIWQIPADNPPRHR